MKQIIKFNPRQLMINKVLSKHNITEKQMNNLYKLYITKLDHSNELEFDWKNFSLLELNILITILKR